MDQGQRWIVTGASKGIGRAIAELALQRGHRVGLLARSNDVPKEAPEAQLVHLPVDVRCKDQVKTAIDFLAHEWGGLDVVINNAGLHRGGLIGHLLASDWNDVLETNLHGPFHVIGSAIPHMKAGGSIVNIGAVVGLRGFAGDAPYASSKAGLVGLSQALAIELARRGIRVNVVVPGLVSTDMTRNVSERSWEKLLARIPLGREGTAMEIAEVVHWVAGSTYMTGAVVPTDGGLMAQL